MSEWRSTATAPDDCTSVLVYTPHGYEIAHFDGRGWYDQTGYFCPLPLAWMPLPPEPKSTIESTVSGAVSGND